MAGEITLRMADVREAGDNLKKAAEGIEPEAELEEGRSELETLRRYRENFERMSLLVKSYAELIEEDRERIYNAALSLVEFDFGLMSPVFPALQ